LVLSLAVYSISTKLNGVPKNSKLASLSVPGVPLFGSNPLLLSYNTLYAGLLVAGFIHILDVTPGDICPQLASNLAS